MFKLQQNQQYAENNIIFVTILLTINSIVTYNDNNYWSTFATAVFNSTPIHQ